MADDQLPLTAHLEELRKRLMIAAGSWFLAFCGCYVVAEKLFQFIAGPVRAALPEGSSLVFINATEPFFTYLKISAIAGVLVALPIILWQAWGFIAPGLYAHEKRFAIPFVTVSCLCFGAGAYFGFTFVFPTVFTFLIGYGTSIAGINAMLSMSSYLTLSSQLLLAFGLVFELPVVIFFLARMGVVDYKWLAKNRKYALLAAFIVGGILTPSPDIFSQTSVAVPFYVLYEVGALGARFFGKKKTAPEGENEEETQPPTATG